jgi:hypothetical protein
MCSYLDLDSSMFSSVLPKECEMVMKGKAKYRLHRMCHSSHSFLAGDGAGGERSVVGSQV